MVGFGQKQNLKTITICDQKRKMMGNLIVEFYFYFDDQFIPLFSQNKGFGNPH